MVLMKNSGVGFHSWGRGAALRRLSAAGERLLSLEQCIHTSVFTSMLSPRAGESGLQFYAFFLNILTRYKVMTWYVKKRHLHVVIKGLGGCSSEGPKVCVYRLTDISDPYSCQIHIF